MKKRLLLSLLLACMLSLCACSMEESSPLPGEDGTELSGDQEDEPDDALAPTIILTPAPTEAPAIPAPTEIPGESTLPPDTTAAPADATETPGNTTTAPVEGTDAPDATATPTEPASTPSPEPVAVETPAGLSDDLYSFQVSINGTIYQFPMWYADFEALGWSYKGDPHEKKLDSYQYAAAETWRYSKKIGAYTKMANLTINSAPYPECMVAGITLEEYGLMNSGWEIILPKGIKYGFSTKNDIIGIYGEPSSVYEGVAYDKLIYSRDTHSEISLYVYRETGTLDKIEIVNIVELEGGNNTVDPTVPEIVGMYKAPTSVGENLYKFNIELEGKLYTLPCPASELLANGFTINKWGSATEIASGSFDIVEFKYNNQTMRTLVHNYADYATIPENCYVTSVESSLHGPDFAMTIPCGIKRGTTEAELLKILKKYNYVTETESTFTYYTVYHPEKSRLESFTITTKEGVVVIIEADNNTKPQY